MAGEPTITQELANKACEEIAASGRRPTLELLRGLLAEKTGTKGGSFTYLGPWLRAWKEAQRTAATEPQREAVPPAVSERIAALASDLWAVASETANARLAGEREAMSKARTEAETETAEALDLAERLTDERDEARAELAELRGQLEQAKADVIATGQRYTTLLEQSRERVEALQQELAATRHKLEQAQKEAAAAAEIARTQRESAERSAADASRRAELLDKLDREHAMLQAEHRASQEKVATLAETVTGLKAELQAAADRERVKIEEAAIAKAEAARLADQLKDQKGRSADAILKVEQGKQRAEAEASEARRELRDLTARLGKSQGELEALRAQVAGQADVIRSFAHAKHAEASPPAAAGKPNKKG
jgi:chromosome segregation ATPase